MSTAGAHIFVYPFPTSGHIIPLLDLTHWLLTRGLTITVLVTPNNRPLLDPLISRHASSSLNPLVLPAPEISPSSPQNRLIAIMQGLRELHHPVLLQWFKSHPSPPVAIVSDFFLGWTQELASQVGVPRVVFSPSGALGQSVTFALWRDLFELENDDPEDVNFEVSFPGIPNCPKYPWYQISRFYRNHKHGDSDWEFYRNNTLSNLSSWGFVFNSFAELERVYFDHLKKEVGHDRIWAVGPIRSPDEALTGSTNRGGSSSVSSHDVMTWLDAREDQSVVYVCFGSRVTLTSRQMDELASALEQSGVYFIWCVRQPNINTVEDYGVIPDGFEGRVAGRGYLIKGWAPQVTILRNRAVGAFLTHCGWNSTLEGIAAGVVMLTWPMDADQFTNAKLLIDELGVGIRVGEATQNIPKSTKLARLLVESVDGTRPERARAKKLRDTALGAIEGGSSDKELDEFLKKVSELEIKRG